MAGSRRLCLARSDREGREDLNRCSVRDGVVVDGAEKDFGRILGLAVVCELRCVQSCRDPDAVLPAPLSVDSQGTALWADLNACRRICK